MKRTQSDPNVKKTLVRNCEQKVQTKNNVLHQTDSQSYFPDNEIKSRTSFKENELNQPSTSSSEVYFNYLNDVKKTLPTPHTEEIKLDKVNIGTKITKKLNFHFNDAIYKNLIDLNSSTDNVKSKKEKQRQSTGIGQIKKDLEPNIEDFYKDEEKLDSPPNIPIIRPTFKTVRRLQDAHLHNLVASFENL